MKSKELTKWSDVKNYISNERITLGPYFSYILKNTPRKFLFILSHYKFAAKLIGAGKYVLEVGCSEGVGTILLSEFAKKVVAIDIDDKAIKEAKKTFTSTKIEFLNIDFLDATIDKFDSIVCFDLIEHIYPENEKMFFLSLCRNLKNHGLCIIGTPNKNSEQYASEVTRIGHVNLFNWEKLKDTMQIYFNQVFIFSANDEIIHTGFYPLAHYLIGVGICKK